MPNIRRHLKNVVTIKRSTGINAYGERSYTTLDGIPALFEPDNGTKITAMGEEVQADSRLLTVDEVMLEDLVSAVVSLPGGGTIEYEDAEVRRVTPVVYKGRAIGFRAYL